MPSKKYSILSLMAKDIIDIRSGRLLNGRSRWLFHEAKPSLTGLALSNQGFIPQAGIKAYAGDVVVIDDIAEEGALAGHDLIGLPIINEKGILLAKIIDAAIDGEGKLVELLVTGGRLEQAPGQPVALAMREDCRLGTDALIVAGDTEQMDLLPADTALYQEALKLGQGSKEGAGGQKSEEILNRLGEQLNDLGGKISDRVKNANTDEMINDFNRVTSKINSQLGDLFDKVMEKTSRDRHERDVEVVMQDLGGQTVSQSINNKEGQAIIGPGEPITVRVIKEIIQADKITELYRMATSVYEEERNRDDLKDQ
ncbi:PRC-barrel domain-containing protein [Peptococcus simiae]|uniref:PRC-barrel domain-containing protein n=1 Tax=Peptococcus simiae TaxID=1643805 RepID=A0ABW9GYA9_9FIRM